MYGIYYLIPIMNTFQVFLPINWQDRDFLPMPFKRVRTGIGQFWKVMEIDNAFFQDLESFEKGRFFQIGYRKVVDFFSGKF